MKGYTMPSYPLTNLIDNTGEIFATGEFSPTKLNKLIAAYKSAGIFLTPCAAYESAAA
jgi:hypothetical protein